MTLIYGFNKYKRIIKCLLISLKYKVIQCLSVSPLSVKYADHNLLIYSLQLYLFLFSYFTRTGQQSITEFVPVIHITTA